MDEEMINDEELRAAIQESLRCRSIEEALIEKEEEDKLFDESFDVLWTNYHSVSDIRRNAIRNLNRAKIRMIVLNFITAIINNNASEEVFNIIEIINNGTKELKDEKELLIRINNALEKLQAHRVSACNYDLCELLSFLYDKYR